MIQCKMGKCHVPTNIALSLCMCLVDDFLSMRDITPKQKNLNEGLYEGGKSYRCRKI